MVPEPAPAAVPAVTSNPIEPEPVAPTPAAPTPVAPAPTPVAPAPLQADADAEAENSAAPPSLPPETGELDEAWEKDDE